MIDQIQAGGGGKATIIIIPCGKYIIGTDNSGDDDYSYISYPYLCTYTGSKYKFLANCNYSANVYIQKENDQQYRSGQICVYELEPSETEYRIYGATVNHGEDGSSDYVSTQSYKFNEAKVYFIDTSQIEFEDTF